MKRLMILYILLLLGSSFAHAEVKINVSTKLLGTAWGGNNSSAGADITSAATQQSIGIGFQKDRLYGRLSIQGASFKFDGPAPTQESKISGVATNDVIVQHGESDILVGYYFWPRISLFADLKSIVNDWKDSDYKMTYTGLGIGVSGYHRVHRRWVAYGSAGQVFQFTVESAGNEIGTGKGFTLDFGMSFIINQKSQTFAGLKSQTHSLEFDNGNKQEHNRGGLYIGIQYQF